MLFGPRLSPCPSLSQQVLFGPRWSQSCSSSSKWALLAHQCPQGTCHFKSYLWPPAVLLVASMPWLPSLHPFLLAGPLVQTHCAGLNFWALAPVLPSLALGPLVLVSALLGHWALWPCLAFTCAWLQLLSRLPPPFWFKPTLSWVRVSGRAENISVPLAPCCRLPTMRLLWPPHLPL